MEKIVVSFFLAWIIAGSIALFTKGANDANVFSGCGFLKLLFHGLCFLVVGPLSFFKKVRAKICLNCFS